MRRRRALVVWAVLAALLALVGVLEYRDERAARTAPITRADERALLPFPVGEIRAVELVDAGTPHRFERDERGVWFYHGAHDGRAHHHTHAADAATSAKIEQAFQAFGRARAERELPRGADPRTYGLTAPRLMILVYRAEEREPAARYAVGDVAPDTLSRYVDVVGGIGVVTIPGYQVDNLVGLLSAVRAPDRDRARARR